jgi:tRNA modification GTPase
VIRGEDRDTIVGIATSPGTGAIGIVRVSGPGAIEIASRLVRLCGRGELGACRPRVLYRAAVIDPQTGADLDSALVVKMPGPSSYTGDDVVEISCHGNPVLLGEVVRHLIASGARLAEPGEFTRQAYLNGRMDLLQVEAVAELIGARTGRAVRLAARQLKGALSIEVSTIRERLVDLMAGLEVSLDFPEEGVGLSARDAVKHAGDLRAHLDRVIESARQGRTIQDGLTMVLVGAPNVGKSSLLNRLLGAERAIVAATPGTTRDLVDGTVAIRGVPVRLVDGAGLGAPRDAVDAEGMRRVRQTLAETDLALVVLDGSRPMSTADREVLRLTTVVERLIVANKCDLPNASEEPWLAECVCSALTGEGVEAVAGWLEKWVERRTAFDGEEGGIVASLRVIDRLTSARLALGHATDILDQVPVEAVLVDLRAAQVELERVLGLEAAEESVLDRIFTTFCIGK